MDIIHNPLFNKDGIKLIEERYSAKYICSSCLKNKYGGYCNFPADFFYTKKKHPRGSNYFAIYYDSKGLKITDGICILDQEISGVVSGDGKIYYSRYRHDFVKSRDKSVFIDGGRDYTKSNMRKFAKMKVIKDKLTILKE